jgi:hypothetical protein
VSKKDKVQFPINRRADKLTKKGTKQNPPRKAKVPGSGRGRPAKGYDPVTKTWHQGGK